MVDPFEGWALEERKAAHDSVKAQLEKERWQAEGNAPLLAEIDSELAGLAAVYGI